MKTLFSTPKQNITKRTLADRFIVPPFSVFNTHQPYWRDRERFWNMMGIGGTNGRKTSNEGLTYDNRRMDKYAGNGEFNGTSDFSATLCEVIYKWFCLQCSNVFDPFAGGAVRGLMAGACGLNYTGYDINPIQVESNWQQYKKLQKKFDIDRNIAWVVNDSAEAKIKTQADLIFTCPPYFNLEKYTDDPNDLSNTTRYCDFLKKYLQIMEKCYNILRDDSFYVYVVSDVRDKKTTEYYGLVADTIKGGQNLGLKFYNEIILYNDTGNLAIVSGDYMNRVRKVGRQHQNILVFYKGDVKHIKEKFGEV